MQDCLPLRFRLYLQTFQQFQHLLVHFTWSFSKNIFYHCSAMALLGHEFQGYFRWRIWWAFPSRADGLTFDPKHLFRSCPSLLASFLICFWSLGLWGALSYIHSFCCKARMVVGSHRGQGRWMWLLLSADLGISCPSGRSHSFMGWLMFVLFVQCAVISVFDPW